MPKTIRNEFDKYCTYEYFEKAHKACQKGKTTKREVILFNLKREEYLKWLCDEIKNGTYTHGGYRIFYINFPRRRKVQVSRYIDRIVHRWIVDNFLYPYYEKRFVHTSYACVKNRGTHNSVLNVQKAMRNCKYAWGEYYILKMDVSKYFQNIDRKILLEILERKITDPKLLELIYKVIYSDEGEIGLPIGNYSKTSANASAG